MRNSYFVTYFFYKNLIFTFPQFWLAFFNGFSGTLLWDDWYYMAYNSFITVVPVGLRMLYEEDIDISFSDYPNKEKQESLIPNIYKEYKKSEPFTVLKFFLVFLGGIIHSTLIYFIPYLCFNENPIFGLEGQAIEFYNHSFCSYISLVLIQIFIIIEDDNYFNRPIILWNLFQFTINIWFFLIHNYVIYSQLGNRLYDQLKSPMFYSVLALTTLTAVIPIVVYKRFKALFSRSIINSLRTKKSEYDLMKRDYENKLENATMLIRTVQKFKRLNNLAYDTNYQPETYAEKKMIEFILKREGKRLRNKEMVLNESTSRCPDQKEDEDLIFDKIQDNFKNTDIQMLNDALSVLPETLLNENKMGELTKLFIAHSNMGSPIKFRPGKAGTLDEHEDINFEKFKEQTSKNESLNKVLSLNRNSKVKPSLKLELNYDKRKKVLESRENKIKKANTQIEIKTEKCNDLNDILKRRNRLNSSYDSDDFGNMESVLANSRNEANSEQIHSKFMQNESNNLRDSEKTPPHDKYQNNDTIIEENTMIMDNKNETSRHIDFANNHQNAIENVVPTEDFEDFNEMYKNVIFAGDNLNLNLNLNESKNELNH